MALSRTRRPGTGGLLTQGPGPARQRVYLAALPFLLMGAVVAVCMLAGPREGFIPVLSLGPALASVSRRPFETALVGTLALAVGLFVAAYDNMLTTHEAVIAFVTILGVTAVGVVASAIRLRQERELVQVRAVAEVAQQVLLRPVPGQTPPLEIAVSYISASAAARIGGDLYEVINTPRHVRFILGDVQGKGLKAVRTAAVVLGAFREAAFDAADLAEIAERIELSLRHQAAEEEFVTVIIGQAASGGAAVEILNCGHPAPLLLRDGMVTPIEDPDPGLALGLASLAPDPAAVARAPLTIPFGAGDQMLFYTDGVSEARDRTRTFYPLSRCGELLAAPDTEAALARLEDDVTRYVGHALDDDAAMLLIRPAGYGAPGGISRVDPAPLTATADAITTGAATAHPQ